MKNKDYQYCLLEVISDIRDRATYLKTIDSVHPKFENSYYEGMAMAYYYILDGIMNYIESHEDLTLEEFGLKDFAPSEVLKYYKS